MSEHLTSPHNPRIKAVARLEKRSERMERRLTVVEGVREVALAISAGIVPVEAYVCDDFVGDELRSVVHWLGHLDATRQTRLCTVTAEVFTRMAVREGSGGVLLVIPFLDLSLAHLPQKSPQFFTVIEGAEKPGNVGAILRTADAAGVHGVAVCGGVDLHNPNVVRASLGTLFTVPVAEATSPETLTWLRQQGVQIVAATPEGAVPYTAVDYTAPTAVVLGSEAFGLSQTWLDAADARVFIPMRGEADSLNLSASTAILLYEVVRQRAATERASG